MSPTCTTCQRGGKDGPTRQEKIPIIDRDEENLTKENISTSKIKREWRQGKSFEYSWSL